MALATYYIELAVEILGLLLILIGILISVEIMTKTAGKLKKVIIYFLISLIIFAFYVAGRILNLETAFTAGKILSLGFIIFSIFFILIGLYKLNKIVNELLNKTECRTECKPKREMRNNFQEKKPLKTFAENIGNKYLDLTGRKPKFR